MSLLDILRTSVFLLCLNIFFIGTSDGLSLPETSSYACVIGGGYSGLAVSRYLKQHGVNFTVFEAAPEVGGTWRFDPHVGVDDDGVPVFTSQYRYLRVNTPRQTMEFGDYPFPATTPAYPSGTCFYKYLKSFVKKFDLMTNIQVRSLVTAVTWAGDHWKLTYVKTDDRKNHTVLCDYVVVANGQYVLPVVPMFPGLETFQGSIIHSHDYKAPEPYTGRRVLLVGAGASGLDLSTQLHNITEKLVHSHHLKYNQPKFADQYVKKPDIQGFVTNGVFFQDGSFEEVDDIIFATGYEFYHPFLDETSGLTRAGKYVMPLYQHIVNMRRPTMTFIGVVNRVITKVMDSQAAYIASLIAGRFQLPSEQEMLDAWFDHAYKYKVAKEINTVGPEMDQYFAKLSKEAGITRNPPVLSHIRDFNAKNRLDDLFNYRDYDYEIIDSHTYKRWYNGGGKGEVCPVEAS
ncbi:senecionine N-oxygenase-like [Maniola hyperantus]|uniref:senecionine N-oxygenase-like n=1 Tax=Aphantopus hyperantus TaxID=2795564 RepID=UPI001567D8D6|nr:senecionine N-oxygenase-like [Maniola hyperantus]